MPATTDSIPGLIVMKDFFTVEEEKELVDGLDSTEQSEGKSWEKLLNRRVKHFGYTFKYGSNDVDQQEELKEVVFPKFI